MPRTQRYRDWRVVLRRAGFTLHRQGKKHETWRKLDDQGHVWRVTLSRQAAGRDVPAGLHTKMLRQAGLTAADFDGYLKR